MNPRRTLTASLSLVVFLVVGCDQADSENSPGGRVASSDGVEVGAGGSFEPDPDCIYTCVDVGEGEGICTQVCPNGCLTIGLNRQEVAEPDAAGTGMLAEFCPGQLPDDAHDAHDLGKLMCQITYVDTAGEPGDCDIEFSDLACYAAYDICRDEFVPPSPSEQS